MNEPYPFCPIKISKTSEPEFGAGLLSLESFVTKKRGLPDEAAEHRATETVNGVDELGIAKEGGFGRLFEDIESV